MPLEFIHLNRVHKTLISLLAQSSNPIPGNGGRYDANALPKLKMPFQFDTGEIAAFAAPDVRIGGFGPLFGGALTISLLGLVAAAGRKMTFILTCLAAIALPLSCSPRAAGGPGSSHRYG